MKQLILPFEQFPAYDVRDFIVSNSNEEAYLWLMRWPDWLHPCLAIYGEKGCGKTHLSSIWQTISKARYLKAQDFNTVDLEILFANPCLFVLDDAHHIEISENFYNIPEDKILDSLRQLDDEKHKVLYIGHNPGIAFSILKFAKVIPPFLMEGVTPGTLTGLQFSLNNWMELDWENGEIIDVFQPSLDLTEVPAPQEP